MKIATVLVGFLPLASAFQRSPSTQTRRPGTRQSSSASVVTRSAVSERREWMETVLQTASAFTAASVGLTLPASAEIDVSGVRQAVEMKSFVDPQGLFSLRVPESFFTLRRTQKGDLPDAKTGKGRRGSSIFTAGDMSKAEVVAVERFPARVLLEENGISPTGDLSTFPDIGDAKAVAALLVLRREAETQKSYSKLIDNVSVSEDGKELTFRLKTEIDVQKPELLLEQYGSSQLFRVSVAKASLRSDDGNIMAVFASALERDFNNGVDGPALQDTVDSFVALPQTAKTP